MRKPLISSITKKLFMAISGAGFVLFLLFHGTMNFVSIISSEAYEGICNFLGANWYAVAATLILAFLAAFHVFFALVLSVGNFIARGRVRYTMMKKPKEVSWASRNMLVLGILVLSGLLLHLFGFWYKMQFAELIGRQAANGMELIVSMFSNNVYSILYLLWLTALWFHLSHGLWSMLQSLGWNSERWKRRWQIIGLVIATLLVLPFACVVVNFWLINPINI